MRRAYLFSSIGFILLFLGILLTLGASLISAVNGQHGLMIISACLAIVFALSPTTDGLSSPVAVASAASMIQAIALQIIPSFAPQLSAQALTLATILAGAILSALIWRVLGGHLCAANLRRAAILHCWIIAFLTALQFGNAPSILSDQKFLYLGFALAWLPAGLISRPAPKPS